MKLAPAVRGSFMVQMVGHSDSMIDVAQNRPRLVAMHLNEDPRYRNYKVTES
jgi:hypothetical protein